jgi:cardiolipin synthase
MKVLGLILFVLTAWLVWIIGKPRNIKLIDQEYESRLERVMPDNVVDGNRVTTYTSFEPMFNQMLKDIDGAKHHVHVQFFKLEADATGQRLGDALVSKSGQGVETRLIYDDFCSRSWKWFYNHLGEQGVQTAPFGKINYPFIKPRDYYRNHRKVVVVDGRVAYVGGMNIADRYGQGLSWGCWRDTMIRIEGPAAAALQHSFLADWCYSTGQLIDSKAFFPVVPHVGDYPVQIITSGPIGPGPDIMHYTVDLLNRSTKYVYFESPYFLPPAEVMEAMCNAASRGVDVRLLQPLRGDRGEVTQYASKYNYAHAMSAGVKIGTYQAGFLHSKTIVSDDREAVVTSCNIDPRSYLLCQEVAAIVQHPDYAKEMKAIFLADERQSLYIDPQLWSRRPLANKFKESMSHIIAPLL